MRPSTEAVEGGAEQARLSASLHDGRGGRSRILRSTASWPRLPQAELKTTVSVPGGVVLDAATEGKCDGSLPDEMQVQRWVLEASPGFVCQL